MSSGKSGNIIYTDVDFDPFSGQEETIPTTEPQREIWSNIQIGGHAANCAYNESVTLTLKGPFKPDAYRAAASELFKRHDALRSVFSSDGLTMRILEPGIVDVPLTDLSSLNSEERETHYKKIIDDEAEYDFDLDNGPLGKLTIVKISENEHRLILNFHHIVCDGWSLGIIMQDLGRIYSAFAIGKEYHDEPALSFRDYAFEEQAYSFSAENKTIEKFWVDLYKNNVPAMEMPPDKPRPALRTYNAKRIDVIVEPELVALIKKTGAKQGCSFVTTLVAAFEVFLHRITGLEDIVVGLPAAGQAIDGKDYLVGHAVNLLPLRSRVIDTQSFNQYLQKRKPEILDAYDHQHYTFGSLINQLNIPRDASRIPLVPVSFNVDIGITSGVNFHECEYSFTTNPRKYENFEIFINAAGSGNQLTLECTHNSDLFDSKVMQDRLHEFIEVMKSIVANPESEIRYLNLLTEEEKNKLLVEWNSSFVEFEKSKCVHQLFEEAVLKYANKIAVYHRGTEITFQDLNEKANRLAHHLVANGAGPEVLIGVCMNRSIDMIISMLAVLKSGSAYVPVDPAYPVERIYYILNDANVHAVLAENATHHLIDESIKVIRIDEAGTISEASPISNSDTGVKVHNLFNTIYTSGSTGKPKGVSIEHYSVNALIAWAGTLFTREQLNGVLASTSICFDISVFEIFVTLCSGGRIVLVKDALELPDVKPAAELVLINTVPSAMSEVLKLDNAIPATVKTILLAGEPLPVALVNKLYKTTSVSKVYDLYGPTEDTVFSTVKLRQPDEPASIGKIIPNSQLYLLDKNMQPVPIGITGEIYIGGEGVSRGYLNKPELTAEKFIPDPFSHKENSRLYKTGDLARFRQDGNIEFAGRIDNQVKIRGFRIELGEIEHLLGKHADIRECIVIAREDVPGEKMVVAYIVLQPSSNVQVSDLRSFLKTELPEFMVPSVFVVLEELPKTPNNKIDRKKLPSPDNSNSYFDSRYEAPSTAFEETLAVIWSEVLGITRIGRKDNFFELGGHSLLAVRMFNEVEKQMGIKMQLTVLFRVPVLYELAALINNEKPVRPWSSLVPLQSSGNKHPLFCIHMHNGNINRWRVLIKHLGKDQPLYALQPRGLDMNQEPHRTIEEMSQYYVDLIREVQPHGPYHLLGLCFSGMVAFEMAVILEKAGEQVNFVGMVNNYAPPESRTLYRIQLGIDKFFRLKAGEKISYAVDKNIEVGKLLLNKAKKLIGSQEVAEEVQVDEEIKELGHDLRIIHSIALLNYQPTHVFNGNLAIIRTSEPIENYYNEYLGWDRLVKGKIETTIIDGCDNDTIITDEPYNIILSQKVREYMEKSENQGLEKP